MKKSRGGVNCRGCFFCILAVNYRRCHGYTLVYIPLAGTGTVRVLAIYRYRSRYRGAADCAFERQCWRQVIGLVVVQRNTAIDDRHLDVVLIRVMHTSSL